MAEHRKDSKAGAIVKKGTLVRFPNDIAEVRSRTVRPSHQTEDFVGPPLVPWACAPWVPWVP